MGPKRKHLAEPGSCSLNFKKERMCDLQASSVKSKHDTEVLPNFEFHFDDTIKCGFEGEIAGVKPIQMKTHLQSAIGMDEDSLFLTDSLKLEVEGTDGEVDIENMLPLVNDTTSMTIGDLISQPLVDCVEIKNRPKTPPTNSPQYSAIANDEIPFDISKKPHEASSDKQEKFNFIQIGEIPFLVKSETAEKGSEISHEPPMSENAAFSHVVDLPDSGGTKKCIVVKDEMSEKDMDDDSGGNELSHHSHGDPSGTKNLANDPASTTSTSSEMPEKDMDDDSGGNELSLHSHGDPSGTKNLVNDTASTTNKSRVVLDPATGEFVHSCVVYDNDDFPENPQVSQVSDSLMSEELLTWNEDNTLADQESTSDSSQPQCSQSVVTSASFVTVSMLLAHSLGSGFWTDVQQSDIIAQIIPFSKRDRKTFYDSSLIFFKEFEFSRFPWLCESPEKKRFFCWPCLLFAPLDVRGWSVKICHTCERDFRKALIGHEITLDHLNAQIAYESNRKVVAFAKKEQTLEKCQKLWKHVVRTVCYEKKSKNKLELMDNPVFTAEVKHTVETIFRKHMSSANLLKLCKKVLAFATHQLIVNLVDDVRNAQYVTLHLEDMSGCIDDRIWLAVIARYANHNGSINEKVIDFVKAYTRKAPRTAETAFKWIKYIFSDYELGDNLVGFSYSASLIIPEMIPSFHSHILKYCPRVMFFHPPCDNLLRSMVQAISHVPTWSTRKYFQEAQELCGFMNKNRLLIESAEISGCCFATTSLPKSFDDHFVANLSSYYSTLLTIFQRIISTNFTKRDTQLEREAKRFNRFLQAPQNRLVIILIGKISSTIGGLAAAIEGLDLNRAKGERAVAIEILTRMKSLHLEDIHEMTDDPTLRRVVNCLNPKTFQMIYNIIDSAIAFLELRFENLDQVIYTSSSILLSTLKLTKYPVQSLDFIKRAQLDLEETTQLRFLMTSQHSPVFIENKNHTELLDHLIQLNKTNEYSGLYKYLLFVHTTSCNKTRQIQLIKSVRALIRSNSGSYHPKVKDLSRDDLYGFFWNTGNGSVERMLDDPEIYIRALEACKYKMVVDSDFQARLVECGTPPVTK